jgi:hypothetical protein
MSPRIAQALSATVPWLFPRTRIAPDARRRRSTSTPAAGWMLAFACLAGAGAIVLRGCGYDAGIPLRYGGYFALQIGLPGVVALYLAGVRPLTPSTLIALGIPTGFAIEIFTFLGLSAADARGLMPFFPALWLAAGWLKYRRGHDVRWRADRTPRAGVALSFAVLFLAFVGITASQMYSESPLVAGLPQRPIFHDWVYLLSRAAAIKHGWPLQDPSLAGTPLQYHYFLLVHVASASVGTTIDVTWVLLRLAVIPLGVVLITQAYVLGRRLSGARWGGVVAAALTILPGEASRAPDYGHLVYLGLFLRWLYVSPTFFFGLIYFGALLLAIPCVRLRSPQLAWVALLAAAGTAAKGSVLPVLLLGLAVIGTWTWIRDGRFPRRIAILAATCGVAFATVYGLTMADWGSGEAIFQPFRICYVTEFWDRHAVPVQRALKRGLHAPFIGTWLGQSVVAAGVIAGTAGVRSLALPYLLLRHSRRRTVWVRWLGSTILASFALGLLLHFDGDSELYFIFLAQLPLAALAAAGGVEVVRRWRATHRAARSCAPPARRRAYGIPAAVLGAGSLATACLVVQVGATWRGSRQGWNDWLHFNSTVRINDDLLPLYETTRWLKAHTEEDAILLSNAFTLPNLRSGRGILVDHTTAGVHYYLSALSERRLWIEGPTYLLDQAEARHRLVRAAELYYHARPLPPASGANSRYAIVDHSIGDDASVPPGGALRVFANRRFEVFQLASAAETLAASDD